MTSLVRCLCAVAATVTMLAGPTVLDARAQAKVQPGDTVVQVGLGLVRFSKTKVEPDMDPLPAVEQSTTGFGALDSSSAASGIALTSDWVLLGAVSVSSEREAQTDSDDLITTSITAGPVLQYLFLAGDLRPYVQATVLGVYLATSQGDQKTHSLAFGFGGGIGLHWFAGQDVSISPNLDVAGVLGSSTIDLGAPGFRSIDADLTNFTIELGLDLVAWL